MNQLKLIKTIFISCCGVYGFMSNDFVPLIVCAAGFTLSEITKVCLSFKQGK